MAKTTDEMIEEFKSFTSYVMELDTLSEQVWNTPIAEGKWTLKDVIAHIMLWDQYFYEEAIYKIKHDEPLTVRHLNFNEFNANAMEYSKTKSKKAIVEELVEKRMNIIHAITGLQEEEYTREYKDGDKKKFSIKKYVRAFISHDKHHKKQIESFKKLNSQLK
ncbi:DinB family protein [Paenibacillus xylanilyticus]|uniref:DinB family protein n=1 Tax=Paenibacillus xylanilyticus TaxID=248903 RepID=UPI0039A2515E